jgi:hypothetical protein
MSDSSQKDAGMIQVLLTRLDTQRLPRALALKKKVDGGEPLNDLDTQFLTQVLEEMGGIQTLAAKHPEYQSLVARLSSLYAEITRKGLENAQKKS